MDTRYDSRFLRCHVLWTHLHHWNCHRHSGRFIQRGDRHSKCAESGQESAIHPGAQLVLFGDYNVLSVWGECDILLQAYCACRQSLAAVRNPSSVHQLHAIRYGSDAAFCPLTLFAKRFQPICCTNSLSGFVFFVGSLQKGHYRFQFTQFAWTHMALYLIVVQAHFIMNNIFEGMIWVFLPASLVITNDIFAYICGITFGRTQLIKLSPKKTVEGFVGAWVLTIVFGFAMTNVLMRYKYFICPVNVRVNIPNPNTPPPFKSQTPSPHS